MPCIRCRIYNYSPERSKAYMPLFLPASEKSRMFRLLSGSDFLQTVHAQEVKAHQLRQFQRVRLSPSEPVKTCAGGQVPVSVPLSLLYLPCWSFIGGGSLTSCSFFTVEKSGLNLSDSSNKKNVQAVKVWISLESLSESSKSPVSALYALCKLIVI